MLRRIGVAHAILVEDGRDEHSIHPAAIHIDDLAALGGLFVREVLLGLAVGAALGFACSRLTSTVDDHLIEMMLSVVLAYGSYLVADGLHASGPLACVAAGIVQGLLRPRLRDV